MKLVGLSICLTLALACKKEDEASPCEQLEGTWSSTSWTEDGQEFLGDTAFITGTTLVFKTLVDNQGDYTWDINYQLGGPESVIGAYMVNTSCDLVVITPKAGVSSTYAFTIDGDQLTLEGTINGIVFELVFERQ